MPKTTRPDGCFDQDMLDEYLDTLDKALKDVYEDCFSVLMQKRKSKESRRVTIAIMEYFKKRAREYHGLQ